MPYSISDRFGARLPRRIGTALPQLIAASKFAASLAVASAVKRIGSRWVFGSGEHIDPAVVDVARRVADQSPDSSLTWLTTGTEHTSDVLLSQANGVRTVPRDSWRGLWSTVRAGHIITAHGLGDANRWGVYRGKVTQLVSAERAAAGQAVTASDLAVPDGPALLRRVTRKINQIHNAQVALVAVPDLVTARRARNAMPETPGRIVVLANPQDDLLAQLDHNALPDERLVEPGGVFFESFFGKHVGCNPLALDREIATRFPNVPRFWSVQDESQDVPEGARQLLVGSPEWFAARRLSPLLIVNDWLRFNFTARAGQFVVQTWHGTMLKALALAKPDLGLRSRRAVRRESARWDMMLSQNPHSSRQFRTSYAFNGIMLETGYPRDDELVHSLDSWSGKELRSGQVRVGVQGDRVQSTEPQPVIPPDGEVRDAAPRVRPEARAQACAALRVNPATHVLVYAPTWRDSGSAPGQILDVDATARALGPDWTIVVRGHTRATESSAALGPGNQQGDNRDAGPAEAPAAIVDASSCPNVNTVFLAADVLVTDYSSVMFDAAITGVPMAFFAPDIAEYERDRGFTFDFQTTAPGPVVTTPPGLISLLRAVGEHGRDAEWVSDYAERAAQWRTSFLPHDDGFAAKRVVDDLASRGLLQ